MYVMDVSRTSYRTDALYDSLRLPGGRVGTLRLKYINIRIYYFG